MSESPGTVHLNNHHRDTLVSIFHHPTSNNIEWKAVVSLLDVVGEVEETKDGRLRVLIGGEAQTFARPRNKDVDVQTIVDLRRMLTKAGYAAVAEKATDEGKEV